MDCRLLGSKSHFGVSDSITAQSADFRAAVCRGMAICTERDEVVFRIRTAMAAEILMMYFEVLPGSAVLTTPAVAPQHVLAKFLVFAFSKPEWCLPVKVVH